MANILFINYSINPEIGGVEKVTCNLAELFSKNGHTVFATVDKNSFIPQKNNFIFVSEGFENIENFILLKKIDVIINQAAHDFRFVTLIKQVRASFPEIKIISCLHNNPIFLHKFTRQSLIKNKLSLKLVVKWGFLPIYLFLDNKRIKQIYKQTYLYSDKVILLSKEYCNSYVKIAKLKDSKKISSIPNSLDLMPINSVEDLLKNKKKKILMASRIVSIKRIDLALKMWKQVQKYYLNNSEWIFQISGDGPELKNLKRLVVKLNISNVEFTGHISDLSNHFQESSIYVMTSLYEGFPMVLLESQTMGTVPIVFDSYEAVHDVITDNKSGIIIKNNDTKEFIKKLIQLMEKDELRESLARNGIDSCKKYTSARVYELWEKILEEK